MVRVGEVKVGEVPRRYKQGTSEGKGERGRRSLDDWPLAVYFAEIGDGGLGRGLHGD